MNTKPLRDFVFLTKDDSVKQTASGLYLPGEEKTTTATVVAAGPGKQTEEGSVVPMTVKAGDRVLFPKNIAVEVTIEGVGYWLLREEQLIGIIG